MKYKNISYNIGLTGCIKLLSKYTKTYMSKNSDSSKEFLCTIRHPQNLYWPVNIQKNPRILSNRGAKIVDVW